MPLPRIRLNSAIRQIEMPTTSGGPQYKRDISIIEQSGQDLNNYQVMINLDSSNFNFSHAASDGSDIRIYDLSGNMLSFWIEKWDYINQEAIVWVKVPNLQANSTVVLNMTYGDSTALPASDGDSTFELFDDFKNSNVSNGKWNFLNEHGSIYVDNNALNISISDNNEQSFVGVFSKQSFDVNASVYRLRMQYEYGDMPHGWTFDGFVDMNTGMSYSTRPTWCYIRVNTNNTCSCSSWPDQLYVCGENGNSLDNELDHNNTKYVLNITTESGNVRTWEDSRGMYLFNLTCSSNPVYASIWLQKYDGTYTISKKVYFAVVTKYVYPEPSVTLGSESSTGSTHLGVVKIINVRLIQNVR